METVFLQKGINHINLNTRKINRVIVIKLLLDLFYFCIIPIF